MVNLAQMFINNGYNHVDATGQVLNGPECTGISSYPTTILKINLFDWVKYITTDE